MFWREHVGDLVQEKTAPHFISCPIRMNGKPTRAYVNADGLSADAQFRVEFLDLRFNPIDGYSGDSSVPLSNPGLRQQVTWKNAEQAQNLSDPVRLKVTWEGRRSEDAHLYAAYLEHV